MTVAEVARAMEMSPRSYENLEAGTGRITYDRIVDFAKATNSDPFAIHATPTFGTSEFALRCADNKMMMVMMIAMKEINVDLGDDIAYLTPQELVGGFRRLVRDLALHVRQRETFAEEWLKAGATQLKPVAKPETPRTLRPRRA